MIIMNENERIHSLDILRGLAILGILVVNISTFFHPSLYLNASSYYESKLDSGIHVFVTIFAQGSFYPLFAFLFGYGAILLAERVGAKGLSFPYFFVRRMSILLLIGCVHAFFVWHGDILITYALTGFLYVLFVTCKGKTLIKTGLLLYLIPWSIVAVANFFMKQDDSLSSIFSPKDVEKSLQIYSEGSFQEIFVQRFADWYVTNGSTGILLICFIILPYMLLGAGFAKQKWLVQVKRYRKLLVYLMFLGLIGGLTCKVIPYVEGGSLINKFIQGQFGGPLLTLFYISAIVLLLENKEVLKLLMPFVYVGRLSFSNYIAQSLICTTLSYSYGFGLYGELSYTACFCLALFLFIVQLVLSKWWLNKFRIGPLEYLWRWGTYGRRPSTICNKMKM